MRENRGTHNGRYLLFNDAETRGRFVVMYKDLFVPYSRVSEPVINAVKDGKDEVWKIGDLTKIIMFQFGNKEKHTIDKMKNTHQG